MFVWNLCILVNMATVIWAAARGRSVVEPLLFMITTIILAMYVLLKRYTERP